MAGDMNMGMKTVLVNGISMREVVRHPSSIIRHPPSVMLLSTMHSYWQRIALYPISDPQQEGATPWDLFSVQQ
jgi:hypothetical protein